ncbi:hypothetical protein SRABI45_00973 [Enterobacter ludwigii]|jgi:hypothetical protein|nr:hypothetical protein [Enterobacter ludwigii]CAH0168614.1 hypothetical protein SRABI45_00973 [Enterobacter ludwigii]
MGLTPHRLASGGRGEGDFLTGFSNTINSTGDRKGSGRIRGEFDRRPACRTGLRTGRAQRAACGCPCDGFTGYTGAIQCVLQRNSYRIDAVSGCGGFIR